MKPAILFMFICALAISPASAFPSGDFDPYSYVKAPTRAEREAAWNRERVLWVLSRKIRKIPVETGSNLYLQIAPNGEVLCAEFFDARTSESVSHSQTGSINRLLTTARACRFERLRNEKEAQWFCFSMPQLRSAQSE